MELKFVRVKNFRSVEDSGEFSLEHLTCLVGKNESGKTAILQAIAGLNPHPATPFSYDVERDYPKRFLARYKEDHPDQDALVITTKWLLSDSQLQQLRSEFGAKAVLGNTVTIGRRYNQKGPFWELPIDEEQAVAHLISQAGFSATEKSKLGAPKSAVELANKLKELASTNPKYKDLQDKINAYPNSSIKSRVRQFLEQSFPQFMYFSNYDRMNAVVHLPTLAQQASDGTLFQKEELRGDRLFWEFLEFSGVTLDDILSANTFESFNARLQAASNFLTDQILEYWSQNQDIEVRVSVAEGKSGDPPPFNKGAVGRARIYNILHKADTSFSERSAGFTWFFSFLIKFDRVKKEAKGKVFLLLDEPGLTLHGLAQADLLRYFSERLSPHHQIIYTTHSPFMVLHDNILASRIVEDLVSIDAKGRRSPTGTRVREDVLSADRESIFPLQAALGYSLTQTLFVGKHTILVEGPADILYLQALSAELGRRGRTSLDPNWVICPAGGIDKIHSFVSLFGGNKLDVVAFCDYSKRDRQKIESLKKGKMLKDGGLLTVADFVDQEEADVEDLFEPALFCTIINQAYSLTGKQTVDPSKLDAADKNTQRLVKKAEAYFRTLPTDVPEFDHFRPASWLISNPSVLHGDAQEITKTLDRAEQVITTINALRKK